MKKHYLKKKRTFEPPKPIKPKKMSDMLSVNELMFNMESGGRKRKSRGDV